MEKRLEFYLQTYRQEMERKDRLSDLLTVPVGIWTVLLGVLGYYIKRVQPESTPSRMLGILVITMGMGLVVSLVCFCIAHTGYAYRALPTTSQFESWWQTLKAISLEYPESDWDSDEEFANGLIKSIAECNDINTMNNDKKAFMIRIGKYALLFGMATCAILVVMEYWPQIRCLVTAVFSSTK